MEKRIFLRRKNICPECRLELIGKTDCLTKIRTKNKAKQENKQTEFIIDFKYEKCVNIKNKNIKLFKI